MSLISYLSSEGRLHDNNEEDWSNSRYCDWSYQPPTFITYKMVLQDSEQDVKNYIINLLNNNDSNLVNIIYDKIRDLVKGDMKLVTKEMIEETFKAITTQEVDDLFDK